MGAVKVFESSLSESIEWPTENVSKYFERFAKAAPFYGPNSDEANKDRLDFIVRDNNFHYATKQFRSEYQARLKHIQKHIRIAKENYKYANLV